MSNRPDQEPTRPLRKILKTISPKWLSDAEVSALPVLHYRNPNCTETQNTWRFQNMNCCAICNGPTDPFADNN